MAFSLGSFAGGLGQGVEQGQDIRRRQMEMEATKRMQAAQAAAGAAGMQGASAPPQPPMGQGVAPQGGGGGPPQMLPQPGATPMPSAQAKPPGGMAPPGAAAPPPPPPAGPAKPPMPAPMGPGAGQPAPAPPAGGAPGGQPPAPGGQGGAPDGNPLNNPQVVQTIQQSQATLKSMYQTLLQARPDLRKDPSTAFQAVEDMISQMKEVDQSDKNLMLQQNKMMQLQFQIMNTAANRDEKAREHDTASGTAVLNDQTKQQDVQAQIAAAYKRAQLTTSSAERRTAMQDGTRIAAENIIQAGADGRTQALVQARKDALDANLDEKEWQAQMTAQLREQGMSDSYIAKIFSSQAGSAAAGQAPSPPKRSVPKPLAAPPKRGGAPAGGGMSPADIKASVDGARNAIKQNPAAKAAILKHATDSGVPAQALAGL